MLTGLVLLALAIDFVTRTARTIARWITALRHESRQHTVKRQAVIKLLLDEADEITHGLRGLVLEEFDDDRSLIRLELHARQVVGCRLFLANCLLRRPGNFLSRQLRQQLLA